MSNPQGLYKKNGLKFVSKPEFILRSENTANSLCQPDQLAKFRGNKHCNKVSVNVFSSLASQVPEILYSLTSQT